VAQQSDWVLVDDLDGSRASSTVSFGLDGRGYEIDLSEENSAQLRGVLADFVAVARQNGGPRLPVAPAKPPPAARPPVAPPKRRPPAPRPPTTVVRQWARENGHPVADHGRIPAQVMRAYEQRSPAPPVREPVAAATPARAGTGAVVHALPTATPLRPRVVRPSADRAPTPTLLDRLRALLADLARLVRNLAGEARDAVQALLARLLPPIRSLIDELRGELAA
jgi:hypothetical protein